MISQTEAVDLASRQRYAGNLFDQIQERLEELPDQVLVRQPEENRLKIQSPNAFVDIEVNRPIGTVTIKHIDNDKATTDCGTIELSDCRYPWDCKLTLTGCDWLEIGLSPAPGSPNPSLNEYGERIAAALIKKIAAASPNT